MVMGLGATAVASVVKIQNVEYYMQFKTVVLDCASVL
jgi:hypothetical protein